MIMFLREIFNLLNNVFLVRDVWSPVILLSANFLCIVFLTMRYIVILAIVGCFNFPCLMFIPTFCSFRNASGQFQTSIYGIYTIRVLKLELKSCCFNSICLVFIKNIGHYQKIEELDF